MPFRTLLLSAALACAETTRKASSALVATSIGDKGYEVRDDLESPRRLNEACGECVYCLDTRKNTCRRGANFDTAAECVDRNAIFNWCPTEGCPCQGCERYRPWRDETRCLNLSESRCEEKNEAARRYIPCFEPAEPTDAPATDEPTETPTETPTEAPTDASTENPTATTTTTPAPAALEAVLQAYGSTGCAEGAPVTSVAECQAAADEFASFSYVSSGNYIGYPSGCFVYGYGNIYFSTSASDSPASYAAPICKAAARTKPFTITLVNTGPADQYYDGIFAMATAKWESIIQDGLRSWPDVSNFNSDLFFGNLGATYSGAVDDVVLGYAIEPIDGRGGVLGRAGATLRDGNRPIAGIMQFDKVDMESWRNTNRGDDIALVILHEMGHILGLVNVWDNGCGVGRDACQANPRGANIAYTCPNAQREYATLYPGTQLTVEPNGGPGTACAHWNEAAFATGTASELMTGTFERGLWQPISRVTVAALDDLGVYGSLDYDAADSYPYDNDRRLSEGDDSVYRPTRAFTIEDAMQDVESVDVRDVLRPPEEA
mmetsp:Transcript_16220/g.50316  ORF Transcript_16220/g.50316 Transcript_16220/m.50316 type:complete len:548 (-) Transcript_16220:105-1748(-)